MLHHNCGFTRPNTQRTSAEDSEPITCEVCGFIGKADVEYSKEEDGWYTWVYCPKCGSDDLIGA